jgi:hypothetical protein
MSTSTLSAQHVRALAALANDIIPADGTDAGAAAVDAGPRLAAKVEGGWNRQLYLSGLELADALATQRYGTATRELNPGQVHELLALIREQLPAFFKQLRMDVSALYLSDPAVWRRIGFPGPSTESGGYPDFDQPQTERITHLKEAPHEHPGRPPGR